MIKQALTSTKLCFGHWDISLVVFTSAYREYILQFRFWSVFIAKEWVAPTVVLAFGRNLIAPWISQWNVWSYGMGFPPRKAKPIKSPVRTCIGLWFSMCTNFSVSMEVVTFSELTSMKRNPCKKRHWMSGSHNIQLYLIKMCKWNPCLLQIYSNIKRQNSISFP